MPMVAMLLVSALVACWWLQCCVSVGRLPTIGSSVLAATLSVYVWLRCFGQWHVLSNSGRRDSVSASSIVSASASGDSASYSWLLNS